MSIRAPRDAVLDFVSDPLQLPRWAPGFAPSVRAGEGDEWVIEADGAPRRIKVRTSRDAGTVDLLAATADGSFAPRLFTRVVGEGADSEYVFTLLLSPGLDDEGLAELDATVAGELRTLRGLLEATG